MRISLILFLSALPVLAYAADAVRVSNAVANPSYGQPNGLVSLTLQSSSDDALTGVTSPCCKAVELHEMRMDSNIMRMRKITQVKLPAKEDVTLDSGAHVMLIGLKKSLKPGDHVPLTLHFAHAPDAKVDAEVRAANHGDMDDMDHMQH